MSCRSHNLSGSTRRLEPGDILGQVDHVQVKEAPSMEATESPPVTLNNSKFTESQFREEV